MIMMVIDEKDDDDNDDNDDDTDDDNDADDNDDDNDDDTFALFKMGSSKGEEKASVSPDTIQSYCGHHLTNDGADMGKCGG